MSVTSYVQFEVLERAEKAESELAAIRGRFKLDRLSLEGDVKQLQAELQAAKQDASLARQKTGVKNPIGDSVAAQRSEFRLYIKAKRCENIYHLYI